MTGHLIGAAGAVEFIATVRAIREGLVPPTVNCDDPEDRGLNHVPHRPQRRPVRVAISNSFGFAGHNAVLAVRAWTDD
jgi:3-oxoacyl-[acyl-carrier-protein] synthase II